MHCNYHALLSPSTFSSEISRVVEESNVLLLSRLTTRLAEMSVTPFPFPLISTSNITPRKEKGEEKGANITPRKADEKGSNMTPRKETSELDKVFHPTVVFIQYLKKSLK